MKEYDIAIIGAGPAGMMAAIAASQNSCSVILLEKNDRAGVKLLLTGGGRCNITNLKPTRKLLNFYDNSNFLKHSFYSFSNEKLLSFFEDKGLSFHIEDNDRVFPETNRSDDVLKILLECLDNVVIRYNFEVKSISDDFIINDEIKADRIIIATGGVTYHGSFTNYALTSQPVTDIRYGLAPLKTRRDFSSVSGLVLRDVGITYNKKIRENVLFSHVGISGPGIIDISNEVSKSITYNLSDGEVEFDEEIRLDLTPDITRDKLSENFTGDVKSHGKTYLKNYLKKYLTSGFIEIFLDETGVDGEVKMSQLSRKDKNKVIENMKNFPIEIIGFNGELSKVTIGGIDLNYVNPKTLESTVIPKLFFAGEVLDLHGPTGGYNLKIAFSTGYLAGTSASK